MRTTLNGPAIKDRMALLLFRYKQSLKHDIEALTIGLWESENKWLKSLSSDADKIDRICLHAEGLCQKNQIPKDIKLLYSMNVTSAKLRFLLEKKVAEYESCNKVEKKVSPPTQMQRSAEKLTQVVSRIIGAARKRLEKNFSSTNPKAADISRTRRIDESVTDFYLKSTIDESLISIGFHAEAKKIVDRQLLRLAADKRYHQRVQNDSTDRRLWKNHQKMFSPERYVSAHGVVIPDSYNKRTKSIENSELEDDFSDIPEDTRCNP